MTTYDPAVIQRSADRLYARAAYVPVVSAILGVLIGFVGAPYLLQALPPVLSLHCPDWVPAVVLGIIGLGQGLERGAQLRLQAQAALCQLEIERNTRGEPTPVKV
jgi:hypothetical protein